MISVEIAITLTKVGGNTGSLPPPVGGSDELLASLNVGWDDLLLWVDTENWSD